MTQTPEDTIVAVASAPGGAARGILRLSGPDVRRYVEAVFRTHDGTELSTITHAAVVAGSLSLVGGATRLPCELCFWPGRRSYTGQPVAEIHTLGSRPLLEAALAQFCAAGARLAEPGEFTLRAFLAGRLDLVQAEAVLGVIDAANTTELDVALAQLAGGLGAPLHRLRDALLDLLAHLEAGLDFAEEDISFITASELEEKLAASEDTVAGLAHQMASRHEAADLVRVVLVGSPNTGKSSLFNVLAGKIGALVSELPGTTRDYLTAELDLGGVKCLLIDTAGIRPELETPADQPEHAAQAASARQSRQAHVQILCLDSTRLTSAWEAAQLAPKMDTGKRLVVLTKVDAARQIGAVPDAIETSSVTGLGIDALRAGLGSAVFAIDASGTGVVAGTAIRCRESLRLAAESLQRARKIARDQSGEELVAAEVRLALEELGKVVGAVYTEDVLDRIFSRFCIGK